MLEVRGLTKIYKPKKETQVVALDDVTVQFPKTGMVFLLGKSGSGKSTLLNVCGGLDAPTSGEILVKGRSSKEFSQSDFDSYRNTYVGFIFQEYNILNEFSVEDNIALALELQGKPKDKKVIAKLLEEVDLEGYAKRKPNTLSGGQKQRIAIARALVKSPEIIMADEPTGALDSATGKQVFDTLKKLSKDKLVIVVSHDREFAEMYADRIIELKDGKILSDVSKKQESMSSVSENVSAVGDVLCIQSGNELSDNDFEVIRTFLKKSNGDIIIANNEQDVKTFKRVSRISDHGGREVFCNTEDGAVDRYEYTKEESKFIRSKLPAKHAMRIGVSSLKLKPVRLFFTILLCSIAFILFGLLSTMSFYDSEAAFKQTMRDTEQILLQLQKDFRANEVIYVKGEKDYSYETYYKARFKQSEIDELKNLYGTDVFGGVYFLGEYNIRSQVAPYWMSEISSAVYLGDNHSLRNNLLGAYPEKKDEICISSYSADVLMNCKTYDDAGNIIDVSEQEALIGKKINLNGQVYTITGIFESGSISEKYDSLKTTEERNEQLQYELSNALSDGLHFMIFVSYERLEQLAEEYQPYTGEELAYFRELSVEMLDQNYNAKFEEWSDGVYEAYSKLPDDTKVHYVNDAKETLSEKEIIVSADTFFRLIMDRYYALSNEYAKTEDYEASDKYNQRVELLAQLSNGGVYKYNEATKQDDFIAFTLEEYEQKAKDVFAKIKKDGISLDVTIKLFNSSAGSVFGDAHSFEIVGFAKTTDDMESRYHYVNDSVVEKWWDEQKLNVDYYSISETKYVEEAGSIYDKLYLPFDKSEEQIQNYWEMYSAKEHQEDDSRILPTGIFVDRLQYIDSFVKELSTIFLYVGIVLAVFAALLLSNFISVSISYKKKEIGILRAVGARSLDVFKIFFSESFAITAICVLIASVGSAIICSFINAKTATQVGASLFVFGIASFVVLILIALVTTVVATFLPVWNAARKKPVDSIRSL